MRQNLVELVEQKHSESLNYHGQLQALLAEREQLLSAQQKETDRVKEQEEELKAYVFLIRQYFARVITFQ